jgi:undecaprenyl-diphosphatase
LTPFDAVILGLIQGLTEFLPISSSAHVQIAQEFLGLTSISKPELTAFIATIQLGTEAAVLIYFWRDLLAIVKSASQKIFNRTSLSAETDKQAKLGWLILIGSIPVVVIGLIFKDLIENQLRSLWVIAFTMIIFGLVLGVADRYGKRTKSIERLSTRDGLLFGLGQALAVIPGVSRSGGTISVGLAMGYSRQAAARYSFLLAVPAVIASGLYQFAKTYQQLNQSMLLATLVATVVSFAVGFSVIVGLLRYLERGSFMPFVIWRVLVGVVLLILLGSNQISG